jgi:hypothetical protein
VAADRGLATGVRPELAAARRDSPGSRCGRWWCPKPRPTPTSPGSPCSTGLYAIPLALLGYAISGSSRELVVGPSASVVALSASAVGAVAVAKARRRPGEPGSIIAIPHPRRSRSSQPRTWCTIRLLTKRRCTAFSPARGRPAAAARASPRASRRCPARHRSPSPPAQGARPGLAGRSLQVRATSVRDGPRAGRAYGSCRVRLPR